MAAIRPFSPHRNFTEGVLQSRIYASHNIIYEQYKSQGNHGVYFFVDYPPDYDTFYYRCEYISDVLENYSDVQSNAELELRFALLKLIFGTISL